LGPKVDKRFWVCCQIGARENYSIPRALQSLGRTAYVVTDFQLPLPALAKPLLPFRMIVQRHASGIPRNQIRAANVEALTFRVKQRIAGERGWRRTHARNLWFEQFAAREIWKIAECRKKDVEQGILFAYSYAALGCLRAARAHGWRTVVGQLDPGPFEEAIVAREVERRPELRGAWSPAPPDHWEKWREEMKLADAIIVNSDWSREGLIQSGVPLKKLVHIPLAYEPSESAKSFARGVQLQFTHARPLRILFLGQINLRKGIGAIFEAARLLAAAPVEFVMVGPVRIAVPDDLQNDPRFKWVGPVPNAAALSYFRDADVFLFPTLSDGFGLTQLEAFSWGLPMIVSRHCGAVVENGRNGVILEEVSGLAIADALRALRERPQTLVEFHQNVPRQFFGLKDLGEELLRLESTFLFNA
jgi:glycosyltransferase involved in cell wall biosynthesis